MVSVKFYVQKIVLYICGIYIPPGTLVPVYAAYNYAMRRLLEYIGSELNDRIIIVGFTSEVDDVSVSFVTITNYVKSTYIFSLRHKGIW